jgi:hypothetical protein
MFKKKNPPQASVNATSPEDDDIIDLTEEVVIKTEAENGIIDLTDDLDEDTLTAGDKDKSLADEMDQDLTGVTDGDTGDTKREEDLFDHEEKVELEYESDEDAHELIELDDERADESQDFVNIVLSESTESDRSDPSHESAAPLEQDSAESDNIIAPDAERENESEIIAAADDEAPEFVDSAALSDLETVTGFEFEEDDKDDGAPADEEPQEFETENEDDITEITEFDAHYPAADEALLKQSGILGASAAEEEGFLELIEVEEDNLTEDKDLTGVGDLAGQFKYGEVNHLFSDGLEETPQKGVTEPAFNEELKEENPANDTITGRVRAALDEEGRIMEDDKEDLAARRDLASEASNLAPQDEKSRFNFAPGIISQQVDRLDTLLSEDSTRRPDSPAPLMGQAEEKAEDIGQKDLQAKPDPDELPAVTPGQIDAAVERVISQKFSGQIENIIYKVIEKAVTKEIDRLKRTLLENDAIDDGQ